MHNMTRAIETAQERWNMKGKKSNRTKWRNGYSQYPLPSVRLQHSSKPLNEGSARGKPLASILNHIFMEIKNETHLYLFPLFFVCDVMFCFSTLRSLIRRKKWPAKKLKKKQVWVLALCADRPKQTEWNGLRVLTEFLLTTGARKIYSGF